MKHILLEKTCVFLKLSGKKLTNGVAVGKRSAVIFAVEFFYPSIHGKTVRAVKTEKSNSIGNLRPNAFEF